MATAESAAQFDNTSTKDSFIPLFDGQPSSYQEWRKRIKIYQMKMAIQKRQAEAVLNLIGSLQGTAWKIVESFDLSRADKDGAFEEILKLLDAGFQYDDRVQLPQDFENFFSSSGRRPGQTLLSYVTDFDEKLRKIEHHGVKLPAEVQGWFFLKKASITKEQRQLVMTHAPKMEKLRVQESLFLILGQDHKSAVIPDRRHHKGKGRGYVGIEEPTTDVEEPIDDFGFYEEEEVFEAEDESWQDDEPFDYDAIYFQADAEPPWEPPDQALHVAEYDEAYATYVDARRRFQDLKLSRGYLPVVALQDPQGSSMPSSNATSPGSSPTRKGGKGGYRQKGKGKGGRNIVRYPSRGGGKAPDPRGRASAVLSCLRCGSTGHQAAQCPRPAKSSAPSSSSAPASKKPHVEGMALSSSPLEAVIFEDGRGQPRYDCTMLDPGASAFLMGSGPLTRYVEHLEGLGFPVAEIQMKKTHRVFHFGGDHSAVCNWTARLPVFINHNYGYVTGFILKGETPMLMGRPIIEELGITINFRRRLMKFETSEWMPILLGKHAEYLLPLTSDHEPELMQHPPSFNLVLVPEGTPELEDGDVVDYMTYKNVEGVFQSSDQSEPGDRKLHLKLWKTLETNLSTSEKQLQAMVTHELHAEQPTRVIWEIYAGAARTAEAVVALGCHVEVFGYETGWDFDDPSHQRLLLQRLREEMPDEIYLSPTCGPWSRMQQISATTEERRERLRQLRQTHHDVHLKFCRNLFLEQVRGGRHAHLEQPEGALSWETTALRSLPGVRASFEQCRYGAMCMDDYGNWLLVKKPTSVQTTKKAMAEGLSLRCSGDHPHCRLEGRVPGGRLRTKFMEDYQHNLALIIANALVTDEAPRIWEAALAVNEPKAIQGALIQLMTEHKGTAVKTVQRLHRNLGHPTTTALVELLEARNASRAVVEVARSYQCAACLNYKKPNQVAPSSAKVVTKLNQSVQADVMWLKSGQNKFPILSMVDEGTKYQAASLLSSERSEDYILALERCWLSIFGAPQCLVTDEGRGWLSEQFAEWSDTHAIHHVVAPGEAHEKLALVERRHALLRKAVEIYLADLELEGAVAIRQALVYIIPQMNASPTSSGFSPTQWVLGQQPHFPGDLLDPQLSPAQLQGAPLFETELQRRSLAKMAIVQADTDQKLRRALLRRYAGTNMLLHPGQKCYYWRDARAPDLIKIRWKGPAVVVAREDDPSDGRPRVYWISHKTQLLRCAPHHVRPELQRSASTLLEEMVVAKEALAALKSRGVTRYSDLLTQNKRRLEDVDTDEEVLDEELADEEFGEPPLVRRRLVDLENADLDDLDMYSPSILPAELERQQQNVETQPHVEPSPLFGAEREPDVELPDVERPDAELPAVPEDEIPPTPPLLEPSGEPSPREATSAAPAVPLDPVTASLYEKVDTEDFQKQRLRVDRQETLSFAPWRSKTTASSSTTTVGAHGAGPYEKPNDVEPGWSADVTTAFLQGLPQERKLWVRLPADAAALLGGDSSTRMLLHKPVYGQLDAPKRWYLEACRRLKSLGWRPHALDPCLWLL